MFAGRSRRQRRAPDARPGSGLSPRIGASCGLCSGERSASTGRSSCFLHSAGAFPCNKKTMLRLILILALVFIVLFFLFPEKFGDIIPKDLGEAVDDAKNELGDLVGSVKDKVGTGRGEVAMRPAETTQLDLELMAAIQDGRIAEAKAKIESGANPNARLTDGSTPLVLAAARGQDGLVRFLLERGARVNGQTSHGQTALLAASGKGHEETARALLSAGADPNLQSHAGNFALLEAARGGHSRIVRLLLDSGASVNLKATNGWTALAAAERHEHTEIARLLRDAGARN